MVVVVVIAVFVVFVVIFVIVFVNVFVVVVVYHPSSLAFKFGQQSTVIFYSIYCMLNAVRVCYICYIVCCMLYAVYCDCTLYAIKNDSRLHFDSLLACL